MGYTWIYGVILAITGSVGDNLGNNIVSYGHKLHKDKMDAKHAADASMATEMTENPDSCKVDDDDKSCLSWCNIGRIIFVTGSFFTFASFAFGAQSLLASLDSAQFVSNVFFVHFVHKQQVTKRMVIATLAIVAGNVLAVIFGVQEARTFDSDGMIQLYKTNYIYHGYMVAAFIVYVITSYTYSKYHRSRMHDRTMLWKHSFLEPFCYAVSSAIVGTQAVLNSKCLALLLETTLAGRKNEFLFWYLYFILGTWLVLVSYWLTRLDGGLMMYPPSFIIPMMQVFFVFFAIVCGGFYFKEFEGFTTSQFAGFSSGVCLILIGVYILAPSDLELHVPGDPKGPADNLDHSFGAAPGTILPEVFLPEGEADIESGELDKKISAKLSLKPVPEGALDVVNLFQAAASSPVPPFDPSDVSSRSGGGASKKNRKVVKRPQNGDTFALPPLQLQARGSSSSPEHAEQTFGVEMTHPGLGVDHNRLNFNQIAAPASTGAEEEEEHTPAALLPAEEKQVERAGNSLPERAAEKEDPEAASEGASRPAGIDTQTHFQ